MIHYIHHQGLGFRVQGLVAAVKLSAKRYPLNAKATEGSD